MRFVLPGLLTALIACSAVLGQQRPLLTDDVDITPPGAFEVGAGVDFFQGAKFPLSGIKGDLTRVGDIRVKTGFASNVEFQVEGVLQNYVAITSINSAGAPIAFNGNSANDIGDFRISTKFKLRNETQYLPAIGFKVGFDLPNSNQTRGIGTNQLNVFGKVILQKKFGEVRNMTPRLNLMGNIGLEIMTAPTQLFSQNDVFLYGLAGIFRVSDNVNVVSEVNGRVNTRGVAPLGTESLGQFRLGAQVRASGLRFDAAGAFGLTKYSPQTGFIFGVTYLSPSIFTPAK